VIEKPEKPELTDMVEALIYWAVALVVALVFFCGVILLGSFLFG